MPNKTKVDGDAGAGGRPFRGRGTTFDIAGKLGRDWIGFDVTQLAFSFIPATGGSSGFMVDEELFP